MACGYLFTKLTACGPLFTKLTAGCFWLTNLRFLVIVLKYIKIKIWWFVKSEHGMPSSNNVRFCFVHFALLLSENALTSSSSYGINNRVDWMLVKSQNAGVFNVVDFIRQASLWGYKDVIIRENIRLKSTIHKRF